VKKAENDRRAASFIVSGLPTSNSSTDRERVTQLLESELGVCPVITYTKRLGQSSSTKIQPLLVYLRDTSQAQYIVSHARRLRQSNDPFVKNTIYINMNLTKAAAHAAYEMRCRRRQATSRQSASRRATQPHGTVQTGSLSSSASMTVESAAVYPAMSAVPRDAPRSQNDQHPATSSSLNVDVSPFVPQQVNL